MKKLKILVIMTALLPFILSGCYDAAEIDDEVYALIIGADKGVNNAVRVTVQYPTYKEGGGGGSGMEKNSQEGGNGGKEEIVREVDGTIVVTVEAPTILEGVNIINASVPRRISLMHAKMIIFSEDYAREGIMNYLGPIARFRETRRVMQVVVCKGRAEDFIKENKSLIGASSSKSIELMRIQSRTNGYFPLVTFHDFYKAVLSPYQQACTTYAGTNDFKSLSQYSQSDKPFLRTEYDLEAGELPIRGTAKREFGGTAIFDKGKMVGSLNLFETRYFMLVTGDFQRAIMTIEDKLKPNTAIPLDIRLGRKPKIRVYFKDGIANIDINLNLEADLGAIQSRINYEKLDMIDDLNRQIEDYIKSGIEKVIKKTQLLKTDIFGFGYYIAGNFLTIEEFEKYNWHEHYPEAKVSVKVRANVRRTGLMFGSFPLERVIKSDKSGGEK